MVRASEIFDEDSLRERLKGQPIDVAQVIASRAALRVLPIALSIHQENENSVIDENKLALSINLFRMSFISWVASKYPTHNLATFAKRAFYARPAYPPATDDVAFSVAAVTAAARAHAAAGFGDGAPAVAYAAAAAYSVAAYAAVRGDAEWLENNPDAINELVNQPLWLEPSGASENFDNLQEHIKEKFDAFRKSDLAKDTSFGLIADWYAALLPEKGKPRSLFGEKKDLELATQPKEFWEGQPQEVMDRVAELVGWPEDYRKQEEPFTEEDAPEIPPIKPAAIMPEWRDDKLSLPLEPIENDFSAGDMDQALSALKKNMQDFASDIDKSNNIDPRIVEYISDVAEEAPETVPTQEEFFRFAHKEEVLRGLVDHAAQEWDAMLAARFGGLSLQFSQTVQKFPPWREFIKVEYSEIHSQEDLEKVKELEAMLAESLQDELVEFVDPQVPEALTALTNDIPEVNPVSIEDRALSEPVQRQAYDVLESNNNILKLLFSRLFEGITSAKDSEEQSIEHDEVIEYERFKKRVYEFIVKLNKCAPDWAMHKIYDWMWSLIPLLVGYLLNS